MNEKLKKLAEELSKNPELANRMKSMSKDEVIEAAKEINIELAEEDFLPTSGTQELSGDELSQVAGGGWCGCAMIGSGDGDRYDYTNNDGLGCFCVTAGYGTIIAPEEHVCTGAGTGMCLCHGAGAGATNGMDKHLERDDD